MLQCRKNWFENLVNETKKLTEYVRSNADKTTQFLKKAPPKK